MTQPPFDDALGTVAVIDSAFDLNVIPLLENDALLADRAQATRGRLGEPKDARFSRLG